MLDIVGIGALNVDFAVTSEKMKELPPATVSKAMWSFFSGAERIVGEEDIEKMVSLLGRDSFREKLGGSAFNTVCCIAALGSGLRTGLAGISGETGMPDLSFEGAMDSLGIDRSHLASCRGESSGLCVSINHNGTRSFIHYPGCNSRMADALRKNYGQLLEYVSGARLLHITQFNDSETSELLYRLAKDASGLKHSLRISCDPGYAWLQNPSASVMGILRLSAFIFLNDLEFTLLSGKPYGESDREKSEAIFARLGLSETFVVVKKETEIKLFRKEGSSVGEEAFRIDVIGSDEIKDATGAGDAFDAGFLAAVLLGAAEESWAVELGMMLMRVKLACEPQSLREGFAEAFADWRELHVDKEG